MIEAVLKSGTSSGLKLGLTQKQQSEFAFFDLKIGSDT